MFSAPIIRAIAAASLTDERTVRRWVRGERVRPVSELRIQRALAELGLATSGPAPQVRGR